MPRYAAAVAADPSLVDAHYSQAVLLHQGQQYAQAAASLRRAVALDGNDAQVMAAAAPHQQPQPQPHHHCEHCELHREHHPSDRPTMHWAAPCKRQATWREPPRMGSVSGLQVHCEEPP